MRIPVSWLREYVPIEMPLDELASRLSVTTAEVEGIERARRRRRRRQPRAVPRRPRARGGQAPERRPAAAHEGRRGGGRAALDRLRRLELRRRRDRGGRAAGRGAAERRSQLERRKVRGEVSDGMILAEDEVELGPDHGGIMLLPDGRAGHAARGRAAARRATCCSSSRPATGPTSSPSTAWPARSRRSTTCRSRPCPGPHRGRSGDGQVAIADRGLRGLPALHRPAVPRRRDRAVAGLAARRGCSRPACARSRTSST